VNKAIARIFLVGAILFAALIVNLTYLQVIHARALRDNPLNHRGLAQELKIDRGRILGFDGTPLVISVRKSGFYYRRYPQGSLAAQTIGYDSVALGHSGLEQSMNAVLTGQSNLLGTQSALDRLLGRRPHGADVKLTLVPAVQKVAQQALTGKVGAIVALDPKTGAVIAIASSPTYSLATVDDDWQRLRSDPGAPLLNRATQGLYPPGSSFKVVTAAAGLDKGVVTPTTIFHDTGTYVVYGGKITNYHGEIVGTIDFTRALTYSINTVFAAVGVQIGQNDMVATMMKFGLWQVPPLELPGGSVLASGRYEKGTIVSPEAKLNPLQVAAMAIGQEQLVATPLQMALAAAAVANGGTIMKPYLVQQVIAPNGTVVQSAAPQTWQTTMTPSTAATLNLMMQQVVNSGTGTAAALQGIKVAGKTGTAETSRPGVNQAWFIAFAPADDPKIAICVSIENVSVTGGEVAAPLAAQVMRAALAQPSLP